MIDNNKQTNDQVVDNNQVNNAQINDNQVNNNQANDQNVNKKEKEKGKGTFYGILAFAIFVIMAVGATFAYFTASTNSSGGSLKTGSATLQLEFISYTTAWLSDKLIPVRTSVAEYSVERRPSIENNERKKICVDDFGNQICSVYVFQVRNNANSPQTVSISIASEENGFGNLAAMIYEIKPGEQYETTDPGDDPQFASTDEEYNDVDDYVQVQNSEGSPILTGFEPVYVNRLGVTKTLLQATDPDDGQLKYSVAVAVPQVGDDNAKLADAVTIPGVSDQSQDNYKTFMIVLYVNETGDNQNDSDSNKTFSGRVIVDGSDGSSGVTGFIQGVTDNTGLQSDTGTTETTGTDTTDTTETTETTDTTTTEP
ncbi:MAG: hypothetical protein VZS44_05985 [Bacilli bacterium]|nr:hypothetical protein [Bacilli bacterium]